MFPFMEKAYIWWKGETWWKIKKKKKNFEKDIIIIDRDI